jgi:hypothetical protein
MAVQWIENKPPRGTGWSGTDDSYRGLWMQVWNGHVAHWTVSTEERRLAQGDAASVDAAKLAAHAALIKAGENLTKAIDELRQGSGGIK